MHNLLQAYSHFPRLHRDFSGNRMAQNTLKVSGSVLECSRVLDTQDCVLESPTKLYTESFSGFVTGTNSSVQLLTTANFHLVPQRYLMATKDKNEKHGAILNGILIFDPDHTDRVRLGAATHA